MTGAGATAVPDDGQLLRQALIQGGLTIKTRDPAGDIQFRTVVQIDGDVIHWVRRALATPQATDAGNALADEHLAAVAAQVGALAAALARLEASARRWVTRARIAARGATLASGATAAAGGLGGYPVLAIASGALGVVSLAATRWLAPRVGRRLLRGIGAWLGAT